METRQLVERIAEILTPPACREHVIGDLRERFRSPGQYIADVVTTVPAVIASQIRRTFNVQSFFGQATLLWLAFLVVARTSGEVSLTASSVWIPLSVVIGTALGVLVLCDAYARPRDQEPFIAVYEVVLALAAACFLHLSLPVSFVFEGSACGAPLLIMWRGLLRKANRDTLAHAGGAGTSLDEIRRLADGAYKKALSINTAWSFLVTVVIAVTFASPTQSVGAIGMLILMVVLSAIVNRRLGQNETRQMYPAWVPVSMSGNSHRAQLIIRRDQLRRWVAPIIPCLISFSLMTLWAVFLVPPSVGSTQRWVILIVCSAVFLSWLYLRKVNDRAARVIQNEIDALDASEKENTSL